MQKDSHVRQNVSNIHTDEELFDLMCRWDKGLEKCGEVQEREALGDVEESRED